MSEEPEFGIGQLGLDLGDSPKERPFEPDLAEIRRDLETMLESARAVTADGLWNHRTFQYNKVVFPQMSRWLPKDEAEQLCFEFFKELERIELLMAA